MARADAALLARFDDIARWLTGDPQARAADGLDWIDSTCALLQVPGLASYGLGPDDAATVVAGAARASSMQGNPVVLAEQELLAVYTAAL